MVLIEDKSEDVAVLTISQPERRNALSLSVRERLVEALERLEKDNDIRAIIIVGSQGNFSSGGDLTDMKVGSLAAGRDRFILSHRLVRAIARSSKPVIAAVEGWAAGAGMSLALVCDTIIAAEDAKFVASFGKVGLIGDLGIAHTLPRRVGDARAKQILLYAQTIDCVEGARIGLVDRVVAKGNALAGAKNVAAQLRSVAPLAAATTKMLLIGELDALLDREKELQAALFLSRDFAEGRSAFLEKRTPKFQNQ